jgi:hypothetical protein
MDRMRRWTGWATWLLAPFVFGVAPVPAGAVHPLEKGPYLIFSGTNTEMTVLWQLDSSVVCTIEWGEDTTYSLGSAQTVEYGADHQHAYTITGLSPSTKYFYRVTASDDVATGSFRAAPANDADAVKFFVYGDTRSYPADHDSVAQGIISTYSADDEFHTLVLSVGDLVNDGDSEADWRNQFFDPAYTNIQSMLTHLPYQACMGNHEGSGVLFQKYFPYPHVNDRYWSFDYGPAHFAIVDQYVNYGPGSPQLTWLENDLATTTKLWRFIILHEPGYSAGGHSNNLNVQNWIQPLCEQYGVKFLFAGHNHYYARAVFHRIQHITTGGGGAPLYTPSPSFPCVQTAIEAYHFCRLEIDGIWATLTVVEPDGTVLETLTKGTPVLVGVGDDSRESPALSLRPAAPNPFRTTTSLAFSLPRACRMNLSVYDVGGRRVAALASGQREAGSGTVMWQGRDGAGRRVAAGIYFVRLVADGEVVTRQVVIKR